jgi:hypothetical protein
MEIRDGETVIKLSHQEARDVSHYIARGLEAAIKSHYNRLQQNKDGETVFFEHCKDILNSLEILCFASGDVTLYEYSVSKFKSMFKERRDERAKEPQDA